MQVLTLTGLTPEDNENDFTMINDLGKFKKLKKAVKKVSKNKLVKTAIKIQNPSEAVELAKTISKNKLVKTGLKTGLTAAMVSNPEIVAAYAAYKQTSPIAKNLYKSYKSNGKLTNTEIDQAESEISSLQKTGEKLFF